MRYFYLFFVSVCLTIHSFAQSRIVLQQPASNAVIQACSGTFTGTVSIESGEAKTVVYTLYVNDPRSQVWQKSIALDGAGASQTEIPLEITMLQPHTQYLLELNMYGANALLESQVYSTFITAPCNVVSQRPAHNEVVEACGTSYSSLLTINAANLPATAKSLVYTLFINDPRTKVWQETYPISPKTTSPLSPNPLSYINNYLNLQSNTQYLIEMNILDNNQQLLQQTYSTFMTKPCSYATPRLIDLENNASIDHLSLPYLFIRPAEEHNTPVRKLLVKILVNDPRKVIYETTRTFTSVQEARGNVLISLPDLPDFQPNEQFLVELTTQTATGELVKQNYYTLFTKPAAKPYLYDAGRSIFLCISRYNQVVAGSVTLRIQALHRNARKIKVKVTEPDGTLRSGGPWPQYGAREIEKTITKYQVRDGVSIPLDLFLSSTDRGDTLSAQNVQITTEDSLGNMLTSYTYTNQLFIRLRPNRLPAPTFASPANGDTQVSVRPTFYMNTPYDNAYIPYECREETKYTLIELDRYPADWAGVDYQYSNSSFFPFFSSWTPSQMLQPNTTYQARIWYYTATGGYPTGSGQIVTMTFKTAGSSSARYTEQVETTVFPVPFTQSLRVHIAPSFQNATLQLTTLEGKVVHTCSVKGGKEVELNTCLLPTGMYVVSVRDVSGRTEHVRVVKQ